MNLPVSDPSSVTVIAKPHPFRSDTIIKHVPYGQRINEIMDDMDLESAALHARVFLDEQLIEKAYWHRVKPKAGHRLTVRVVPQGTGNTGKDVLRIVALVGVLALAIAAPVIAGAILPGALGTFFGSGVGAVLLTGATLFGGSLRVNALMARPQLEAR